MIVDDDRLATGRESERGSVLAVTLIVMMSAGAVALAQLTKVMAEVKKVRTERYEARALALAEGELERAKNVVNAAPYQGDVNTALAAALLSDPPLIPGTAVQVEQLGTGGLWYSLEARASFQGITKVAQVFVRERTPVSAYNFFVIDHKLGISGAPRGSIHSNRAIDFYFPWGYYRDQVTAGEGFNYKAGATPENTRLRGPWNPNVEQQDILAGIELAAMKANANALMVADPLIAEVELQGENVKVDLFAPSYEMEVPRTEIQQVFSHYEDQVIYVDEPVYEEVTVYEEEPVYEEQQVTKTREIKHYDTVYWTEEKEEPVYQWQEVTKTVQEPVWSTRIVTEEVSEEVWVEDPPPDPETLEGGYAVGGSEPVYGHWETVTYTIEVEETYISGYVSKEVTSTEKVLVGYQTVEVTKSKKVYTHSTWEEYLDWETVQVGTQTVAKTEKVFSHMESVPQTVSVPVYTDVEVTVYDTVTVPEEFLRTEVVPGNGLIYFEGEVRSLKGTLNGQLSLVSNSQVRITDSIVYVDDAGQQRMLNGLDPTQKYSFNPDYSGDAVLGIMSQGDIYYAVNAPLNIEINASLISLQGKVGFESITVSEDGETIGSTTIPGADPSQYVKDSIRRLGGITSRYRPVTTFINSSNEVLAGFRNGISIMDRNLILGGGGNAAPPFVFQENRPTWSLSASGKTLDTQ